MKSIAHAPEPEQPASPIAALLDEVQAELNAAADPSALIGRQQIQIQQLQAGLNAAIRVIQQLLEAAEKAE